MLCVVVEKTLTFKNLGISQMVGLMKNHLIVDATAEFKIESIQLQGYPLDLAQKMLSKLTTLSSLVKSTPNSQRACYEALYSYKAVKLSMGPPRQSPVYPDRLVEDKATITSSFDWRFLSPTFFRANCFQPQLTDAELSQNGSRDKGTSCSENDFL